MLMAVIPPAPNFVSDTKLDIGSDAKSSTISGESGLGRSVGMGRDWGCAVGVRTEGDTDADSEAGDVLGLSEGELKGANPVCITVAAAVWFWATFLLRFC